MELMLVDAATARRLRGAVRLVTGSLALAAPRLLVGCQGTDPEQDRSGAPAVHSLLAVIAATGRRDEASNA